MKKTYSIDVDCANCANKMEVAAAKTEGVLVSIASGAALHAASVIAKRPENADKNVIVLLAN